MNRKKTCAFFGHSDVTADISQELECAIIDMIEQHGVTTFWCGNKGAFDYKAASAVARLRARYPQIELVHVLAYMPKPGEKLPEGYDASLYPDGLEAVPYRFAISRRNQWMAKNCDAVIACITRTYGGAYSAFHLAEKRRKLIVNLGAAVRSFPLLYANRPC